MSWNNLGKLNFNAQGGYVGSSTPVVQEDDDPNKLEDIIKKLPSKRVGKPEEIADLALFLVSDKSNYINGQILRVDGGMI